MYRGSGMPNRFPSFNNQNHGRGYNRRRQENFSDSFPYHQQQNPDNMHPPGMNYNIGRFPIENADQNRGSFGNDMAMHFFMGHDTVELDHSKANAIPSLFNADIGDREFKHFAPLRGRLGKRSHPSDSPRKTNFKDDPQHARFSSPPMKKIQPLLGTPSLRTQEGTMNSDSTSKSSINPEPAAAATVKPRNSSPRKVAMAVMPSSVKPFSCSSCKVDMSTVEEFLEHANSIGHKAVMLLIEKGMSTEVLPREPKVQLVDETDKKLVYNAGILGPYSTMDDTTANRGMTTKDSCSPGTTVTNKLPVPAPSFLDSNQQQERGMQKFQKGQKNKPFQQQSQQNNQQLQQNSQQSQQNNQQLQQNSQQSQQNSQQLQQNNWQLQQSNQQSQQNSRQLQQSNRQSQQNSQQLQQNSRQLQQNNRQMPQSSRHTKEKYQRKIILCLACDSSYYGSLSHHDNTKKHRYRSRLISQGCFLCKIGKFTTYLEYQKHINSASHYELQKKRALDASEKKSRDDLPQVIPPKTAASSALVCHRRSTNEVGQTEVEPPAMVRRSSSKSEDPKPDSPANDMTVIDEDISDPLIEINEVENTSGAENCGSVCSGQKDIVPSRADIAEPVNSRVVHETKGEKILDDDEEPDFDNINYDEYCYNFGDYDEDDEINEDIDFNCQSDMSPAEPEVRTDEIKETAVDSPLVENTTVAESVEDSNRNDSSMDHNQDDNDQPIGQEHLIAVSGLFCKLCHVFYNKESMARIDHCKSAKHKAKYWELRDKKQ